MPAEITDPDLIEQEADVTLAGFHLWILGREFPRSKDYWDGNWILVKVVCKSQTSRTQAIGTFIHLPELSGWRKELKRLYRRVHGDAELKCMEPVLNAKVSLDKRGAGTFTVNITPDHMKEQHQYVFEIDQSYLRSVISQLTSVLKKHSIRKRIF